MVEEVVVIGCVDGCVVLGVCCTKGVGGPNVHSKMELASGWGAGVEGCIINSADGRK